MKDRISKIFDAIEAAKDIDGVQDALKFAETLDAAGQADFVRRLSTEFNVSARRRGEGEFAVIGIDPLDRADLKQGYRILYNDPAL